MAKKNYPQVPWRTWDDPIAGHPRFYKGGYNPDWYIKEAPEGSYRQVLKWANPKEFKVPSESMFNYLSERIGISPEFCESHKNFALDQVEYDIPCNLSDEEVNTLLSYVDGDGTQDNFKRLFVSYGKTMIDIYRARNKFVENVPDLVLFPSVTEQIEKIVKFCNENKIHIYVFSGGSSVTRGTEAIIKRSITLDLGKNFNKIISFNEKNLTVTVQPGIFGVELETYLNNSANFATGESYTVGHFPQSFERATVGGWVVTKGAGQNSAYYGKAEDLVLYQEYVTPVGKFTTERAPRKATGPSLDHIMMGSEGAYGILTEVTLKLHKRSHQQLPFSFIFKTWEDGVDCMREVMQSEQGVPSVFRISDGEESELGLNMYGFTEGSLINKYLNMRGCYLGTCCLMAGFCDGGLGYQVNVWRNVIMTAKKYGAVSLPHNYVVKKWSSGRFSDPYMRDNFQDFGVVIDTLECAVNWDNLHHVHQFVRAFIKSHPETICTCHISHAYQQGANLYFIWMQKDEGMEKFKEFHSSVLNSITESGASVSHHHGIGKLFAKYNARSLGEVQMDVLKALKAHFDPNNIMNPGGTLALDD